MFKKVLILYNNNNNKGRLADGINYNIMLLRVLFIFITNSSQMATEFFLSFFLDKLQIISLKKFC